MMTQMLIAAALDLSAFFCAGLCYATLSKEQARKDSSARR